MVETFEGELAKSWARARGALIARVSENPSHSRATLWKIQIRILSFFLRRYAADPTIDYTPQKRPAPTFLDFSARSSAPGKPARSGQRVQRLLARIAAANRRGT